MILRTPDERFANLPDWPFEPHYMMLPGTAVQMHYVDEGPRDGTPVLLLHGEPSWAYLYRKIIPLLVAQGHRVLAPDLIGFGRSDKKSLRTDYTFERHLGWLDSWFTGLELSDVTLFCQDWGGLLGLRLVAAHPEKFKAVCAANTGLPTGTGMSEGFKNWLLFSQTVPELPIGALINAGSARTLSDAEIAAYDAPFPDESYKEGARQFPTLVPITPEHASVAENIAAWAVLEKFDKPFVTAFSDGDPVTKGGEAVFQARIPGCAGQPHVILHGGHFLQEDSPNEIAAILHTLASQGA